MVQISHLKQVLYYQKVKIKNPCTIHEALRPNRIIMRA